MALPIALRITGIGEPAPPPVDWLANLPSGMTELDDEPFTTSGGLTTTGSRGSESGFTDATAPYSPDKVVRFVYPAGDGQGFFTGQRTNITPEGTVRVYGCFNIRLSSNYTVHPSTQKITYAYLTQGQTIGSAVIGVARGNGETDNTAGTLRFNVDVQKSGEPVRYANEGTFSLTRNVWHTVEWLQVMNTSEGSTDGIFRLWVDGQRLFNYTNVKYADTGHPLEWRRANLDPYYGGDLPGHTIPSECYIYIDHWTLYTSTSRS